MIRMKDRVWPRTDQRTRIGLRHGFLPPPHGIRHPLPDGTWPGVRILLTAAHTWEMSCPSVFAVPWRLAKRQGGVYQRLSRRRQAQTRRG